MFAHMEYPPQAGWMRFEPSPRFLIALCDEHMIFPLGWDEDYYARWIKVPEGAKVVGDTLAHAVKCRTCGKGL